MPPSISHYDVEGVRIKRWFLDKAILELFQENDIDGIVDNEPGVDEEMYLTDVHKNLKIINVFPLDTGHPPRMVGRNVADSDIERNLAKHNYNNGLSLCLR